MYSDDHDGAMFRSPYETMKIAGLAAKTVRYFHAGPNDRFFYPYRLQPADPQTVSHRAREQAVEFIVDSDFNNPDVSNGDVIDHAIEYDATYIVPKDYVSTPDNGLTDREAREKTTESLAEFFDLYEDADVAANVIIPLQPPHDVHYDTITERFGDFAYYAVGGVAKADPKVKVNAARTARDAVGPYKHLHGFGFGPTFEVIQTLRHEPGLLDSMDSSTLENNSVAGATIDKWGDTVKVPVAKGDDTTSVHGSLIRFGLTHINYMLSPLCDDDELEDEYARLKSLWGEQAGVEDFL